MNVTTCSGTHSKPHIFVFLYRTMCNAVCACFLCICLLCLVFLPTLLSLIDLSTGNPSCSIQYFYIPALNKTLNSQENTTLNFMVELDNPNKLKGIRYNDVRISFFDSPSKTRLIGNYTIPSFYQGHHKKAKKWGQVQPLDKDVILRVVSPNGTAVFWVDLAARLKFKLASFSFINMARRRVRVRRRRKKPGLFDRNIAIGAAVEVNDLGTKVRKKGIKMKKSNSPGNSCHCLVVVALINLFISILINN